MSEREIGKIIAKLDSIHEDLTELREDHHYLRHRITKVEKVLAYGKGLTAGFAVICAYLGKVLHKSGLIL